MIIDGFKTTCYFSIVFQSASLHFFAFIHLTYCHGCKKLIFYKIFQNLVIFKHFFRQKSFTLDLKPKYGLTEVTKNSARICSLFCKITQNILFSFCLNIMYHIFIWYWYPTYSKWKSGINIPNQSFVLKYFSIDPYQPAYRMLG
jgi:hypothetical protein